MAKKLTCAVTGNWSYCLDDRYEKLVAQAGGEDKLTETYVTREGKKFLGQANGDMNAARQLFKDAQGIHKNKIACNVTGELLVISDERKAHLMEKYKTDEAGLRGMYIGRVAKRLRKQMAGEKTFDELDETRREEIDSEIRRLHIAGETPAPAAPKGSKKNLTEVVAPTTTATEAMVQDTTPEPEALDPLRIIDGEDAKARKNRIRREKALLEKQIEAQPQTA